MLLDSIHFFYILNKIGLKTTLDSTDFQCMANKHFSKILYYKNNDNINIFGWKNP